MVEELNKELINKTNLEEEAERIRVQKELSKPNRAVRRKFKQPKHHNVFTKKYKSKHHLEVAWRNFLGEKTYLEFCKIRKESKKATNKKISDTKLKESLDKLIISDTNTNYHAIKK
jgi:tRNA U38,U39,U40 pseudouridine synthase TruA